MWTRWIWCAALVAVVSWRGVAAGAPPSLDAEVLAAASPTETHQPGPSMAGAVNCMSSKLPVQCLERWAGRYRDNLVSEQQSFEARAQHPIEGEMAFSEAKRVFLSMLPGAKEKSADIDSDIAPDDKGRGHKLKKKIHKIIKLIKIILFIVIVKLKMVFMMFMMQTAFQFKLVAITFMILLIKKYYLWVEWKHKKEEKKAVVYYEHAQHQHHYDESDHYHDGLGGLLGHGGQHGKDGLDVSGDPGAAGGWGGWWGKRSAEYPAPLVPGGGGGGAPGGNPSDPALAAQRLAYNAHLQQGGQPPLVG